MAKAAVIPLPIDAGRLGIARINDGGEFRSRFKVSMVVPAATEIVNADFDASAYCGAIVGSNCGLTAKIIAMGDVLSRAALVCAMRAPDESNGSVIDASGCGSISKTLRAWPIAARPLAIAPPMLPAPTMTIGPVDCSSCFVRRFLDTGRPPLLLLRQQICQPRLQIERPNSSGHKLLVRHQSCLHIAQVFPSNCEAGARDDR